MSDAIGLGLTILAVVSILYFSRPHPAPRDAERGPWGPRR